MISAASRVLQRFVGLPRRVYDAWRKLEPSRLFTLSFALLITLGAIGFQVLPGLYVGESLDWVDSFFTSASAVCVTGLIVVDTATFFTPAGQAYILVLIQMGGLGIITFATWIMLSLGQRLSLRQEDLSIDSGVADRVEPAMLIRDVLRFTITIEAIGALLLWLLFLPSHDPGAAAWHAVFHAISAFCNAGFSTFSTNLVGYQENSAILFVVGSLIVAGGLGFLSMSELRLMFHDLRRTRAKRTSYDDLPPRPRRMTIHTRVVLVTTALLIVSGGVLYLLLEWSVTLSSMGYVDRVANALFLSVTARTAGFNSVDYGVVSDGGNFLTILLMMIGGSPGSTAGGIKTTTLALLVLLAVARLRGRDAVEVAHRTVPERTVQRAVGLMVLVLFVLTIAVFLLVAVEIGTVPHGQGHTSFIAVVFEAVSALNTVGLSMGITADLSALGRWIMIALMFLGRVGPMTFAASLSRSVRNPHEVRLPSQDVLIG